MKKLKKICQENSVLLVLFIILIACLIAISVVVVKYFVGASSSKYGERLDGIEKYPFGDNEQNELKSKIKEDKLILDVTTRVSGKTIYISITFDSGVTLVEAQSKALASLEYFTEDTLSFYDIQYMIAADSTDETEGFQIMGARNISGTGGIVWNNNTTSKEE